MRLLRPSIATVVLLLLTVSVIGCRYLLPPDDPLIVIPTRDVVIAAQAVDQGATIEGEMLALRTVPLDDTNSMAFTDVMSVLGRVAAVDIPQSQMITPNLLIAD